MISQIKKLDKFVYGEKYRFLEDFHHEAPSLEWHAKKGEFTIFNGPSFGAARFYAVNDKRLILVPKREAFKIMVKEDEKE